MCGIVGLLSTEMGTEEMTAAVSRMSSTLLHRGPDDAGIWVDAESGVGVGHRRLSIIDLSPSGHQPMISASGRYVIVYNGEIYNYPDLQRELEQSGSRFHGHSDTEVLLAAFDTWGVQRALPRLNGMFAFGVWDRDTRTLTLARDRFGEKPLYYGWTGNHFLFGSELRALRASNCGDFSVSSESIALCLRYGCIPAPHAVYKGFYKLLPSSFITVRPADGAGSHPEPYWSARDVFIAGQENRFTGSPDDAIQEVETALRKSVGMRMISDVPLGAFLSGGIDSSVVVALMQSQSARPTRTFTIGFGEDDHNEAGFAAAVARHLQTEHTEFYVSAEQALGTVPLMASIYDEPFADSSQIPTFLVSKLARQHVTVALSGDGGDEMFAGYVSHFFWSRMWESIARHPALPKRGVAGVLRAFGPATWDSLVNGVSRFLPNRFRQVRNTGEKIHRIAALLSAKSEDAWIESLRVSNELAPVDGRYWEPRDPHRAVHPVARRMMMADICGYLPDDILMKVDRAAMAVSLETRTPFLDPDLFAVASTLPVSMLTNRWEGKLVLRQLLYRYVPRELVDRPKRGFSIPLSKWLRNELRSWAGDLIHGAGLQREYFDVETVRKLWREHLSGKADHANALWNVLSCIAWMECARGAPAHPSAKPAAVLTH